MIHQLADQRGRFPSEVEALPVTEILEMCAYYDIKASWESEARVKAQVKAEVMRG